MYTSSREGTDSFFEAIYTQRAIRRFKPDPVPDDLLLRVLEAATKAPSGSNQQPWRFLVVRDAAKRKAMSEALKAHLQSNEAMRTYFESGAQSDDRSKRLMLTGALELAYHIDAAPAVIIPCLTSGSDRLLGGSSIDPAVQNLLLAARALGLGTVLTGVVKRTKPRGSPSITVIPGVAGRWLLQVDESLPSARVYRIE